MVKQNFIPTREAADLLGSKRPWEILPILKAAKIPNKRIGPSDNGAILWDADAVKRLVEFLRGQSAGAGNG